jgi:putative phosphoesterase
MKIRIGVLSDTHLSKVTEEFEEIHRRFLAGLDLVLHAGDFVSDEIVDFLDSEGFHGVHGNMDPGIVRERLPSKKVIECGSSRIALIHGWGPPEGLEERIWPEFKGVDVIVYGHSHRPANHVKEGILLFNPGTAVGYSRSGPNTLGILEINDTIKGKIVTI